MTSRFIRWDGPTSWVVWSFVSWLCTTKRNSLACPAGLLGKAASLDSVYANCEDAPSGVPRVVVVSRCVWSGHCSWGDDISSKCRMDGLAELNDVVRGRSEVLGIDE